MDNELDRITILMSLKIDFLFHKARYVLEKKFTVAETNMIEKIINLFERGVETISLYNVKVAEYFASFGCVVTAGDFNTALQRHILKIKM